MVQTIHPEVVVRAYDLGGFGDIAGAMRVASHFQRTGTKTLIKGTSHSAVEKLEILSPDVNFKESQVGSDNHVIKVDIAGHYKDGRNNGNSDVPHHFTEDMDNPSDRRKEVPIYLKSGLHSHQHPSQIPFYTHINGHTPMFYRPFREWDLPKPGQRDARRQILEALETKKRFALFKKPTSNLQKLLEGQNKIGFAHISPQMQAWPPEKIFEHPYFHAIYTAHISKDSDKFTIGLFLNGELEKRLTSVAESKYWNVVGRDGQSTKFNRDLPTLLFLGSQPQTTVTGLFLSSDIPNLVTGDLSLSDALYGLIAMDGPAFFYETPTWKIPTLTELGSILMKTDPHLAGEFMVGSNSCKILKINQKNSQTGKEIANTFFERVVNVFSDKKYASRYTEGMRTAIRREIQRRFGNVQVESNMKRDFYIVLGAPYLIQDATVQVVDTLRANPEALAETEKVRRMLKDGVPVSVNVHTGVLEPEVTPSFNFKYGELSDLLSINPYLYGYNKDSKSLIKPDYEGIDYFFNFKYAPKKLEDYLYFTFCKINY